MQENQVLRFGPYQLDPHSVRLWRGKRAVRLTAKAFSVLRYLAERPGRLVTKDELLQAVWPETIVSDPALTVCIGRIRRALADKAKAPRFVETVHRQGYRFIGSVSHHASRPARQKVGDGAPSPLSIMVGREAELTQLQGWLETAVGGERQTVFITGEAGIGKTTLVGAFLERIATNGDIEIGRGQCIEHYGTGEAYLPVLEALGGLCRGPEGKRFIALLSQQAPSWLIQMPALVDASEHEALQRRTRDATRERMLRELAEALDALAAVRTLVLWFEDLQWSDVSALDLLAYIARRLGNARLLVLCTYRPVDVIVRAHPLKAIKQELQLHRQCQELPLELLSEAHTAEYLAARFTVEVSQSAPPAPLNALAQAIHQYTEGNPLFIVNVVDYVVARQLVVKHEGQWEFRGRLTEMGVPDGLRQLIEQQIEELNGEEQVLLATASVAGAEFSVAVVAAAMQRDTLHIEAQCEQLVRRGQFLRPSETGGWLDETVAGRYGFLHALYQRVLYERIPAGQCAQLHKRIGERIEAAYGERADEVATALAMHFEAGRDTVRAARYLLQAGENALRRSAHREASEHLSHGLELSKTLPDSPERIQLELQLQTAFGGALTTLKGFGVPEVEQAFARARELCRQVGETPQLFMALLGLWAFYVERAELTTAQELAEQLLRLAQKVRSQSLLLWAQLALGVTLHFRGEQSDALQHLEQSRVLYDPQQASVLPSRYDPGVVSLSTLGPALWLLGYPEQALQRNQEALTLAQQLASPHNLVYALNWASRTQWLRGEQLAVRELQEVLTAVSREQGFTPYLALASIFRGWLLTQQGDSEEGIGQMREGLAARRAIGAESVRPYYLALFAEAYRQAGQLQAGLTVVAEGLEFVVKTDGHFYDAELYRLKGELLLAQEGTRRPAGGFREKVPKTEECFLKAIEIARRQQAKSLELRAVMSLSRLWRQQGRVNEARQRLAEIYDWFTEGFDTADLKAAKALLEV